MVENSREKFLMTLINIPNIYSDIAHKNPCELNGRNKYLYHKVNIIGYIRYKSITPATNAYMSINHTYNFLF